MKPHPKVGEFWEDEYGAAIEIIALKPERVVFETCPDGYRAESKPGDYFDHCISINAEHPIKPSDQGRLAWANGGSLGLVSVRMTKSEISTNKFLPARVNWFSFEREHVHHTEALHIKALEDGGALLQRWLSANETREYEKRHATPQAKAREFQVGDRVRLGASGLASVGVGEIATVQSHREFRELYGKDVDEGHVPVYLDTKAVKLLFQRPVETLELVEGGIGSHIQALDLKPGVPIPIGNQVVASGQSALNATKRALHVKPGESFNVRVSFPTDKPRAGAGADTQQRPSDTSDKREAPPAAAPTGTFLPVLEAAPAPRSALDPAYTSPWLERQKALARGETVAPPALPYHGRIGKMVFVQATKVDVEFPIMGFTSADHQTKWERRDQQHYDRLAAIVRATYFTEPAEVAVRENVLTMIEGALRHLTRTGDVQYALLENKKEKA